MDFFFDLSPLILLFFLFSFFSCLFISFLPVHVAKTESVDVIYTLKCLSIKLLRGGGGWRGGGQDSSLTVVCNHVLPYLGPAFLWEFWFLLLHLEFEVPNDTEAAILYLKALVPLDKFEGKIPAIILKHQIYCVVKDRTLVDRQLVS